MRIGVDLSILRPGRVTGIERYAMELTRAMVARAPDALVVFTGPVVADAIARLDVEQHRAPLSARLPVDQLWLPAAAARARVDLVHMLAFPTPLLWRGRAVLTVHDATPWLFRDTTSLGMRLYYRPLFPQALRRAAAILTPSASSQIDIAHACGVPLERIRVTRPGVSPQFLAVPSDESPGIPYLLFVGTIEPRKNLGVLIDAVGMLRGEGRQLDLVIAGRRAWGASSGLGNAPAHVRFTGQVTDAQLARLYAGATCFVLPSRYEGFGLPLLEAMAAGAPAVVADIPALRELGADTVRYADPHDARSLARAIAACLDESEATAALARRARNRAMQYSWDRCADETLAAYREVLTLPS